MQARCPHCQSIFPTARGGIQFCPNCGKQINVPLPPGATPEAGAPGPQDPGGPVTGSTPAWGNATGGESGMPMDGPGAPQPLPTVRQPTPWELSKSPKAFFETWKGAMGSDRFWSSVQPTGGIGDALLFAWVCAIVNALLSLPFRFLLPNTDFAELTRNADDAPAEVRELMTQMAGWLGERGPWVEFASSVIFTPVMLIVIAAILHLFCMLFGAAKHGFTATARAVFYGYAPFLVGLAFIPFLPVLAWIYWIVLATWGVARLQETDTGRAVGAVLTGTFVPCCCICPVVIGLLATVFGAALGAR